MINLMRIPRGLQTFIFEIGPRDQDDMHEILLSVMELHHALMLQAHSHRNLSINFAGIDYWPTGESSTPRDTLADLKHLERLSLHADFLFGDLLHNDLDIAYHEHTLTNCIPYQLRELRTTMSRRIGKGSSLHRKHCSSR